MTYKIRRTSQFKRDFRLAEQRGLPVDELEKVIKLLANGETLPAKYKDHKLKGKWKNHRECVASLRLLNEFCLRKTSQVL